MKEIGDFLSINPYKKEMILEEEEVCANIHAISFCKRSKQ
jgi:hypothetical protein